MKTKGNKMVLIPRQKSKSYLNVPGIYETKEDYFKAILENYEKKKGLSK